MASQPASALYAEAHLGSPPPSNPSAHRPKLPTSKPTYSRQPPPSLFQGPPSRNASHISLALPGVTPSHQPHQTANQPFNQQQEQPRPSRVPTASSFSGPSLRAPKDPQQATQSENDRADALWAEMQNTLAEVELSAMNSSHVFGAAHAKALEDLRSSQLALAHAWAKSEADEMGDSHDGLDVQGESVVGTLKSEMLGEKSSPSTKGKKDKGKDGKGGKGTSGTGGDNQTLEEETERDILLARKRREANDRYFEQVNSGVLDVVSKLEQVASAMKSVEKESRDIWSDSDGADSVIESPTEGTTSTLTGSPVSTRK